MRELYLSKIEDRINEFKKEYVFTAIDFVDIARKDTVNRALSRLHEAGCIRRIIHGVYDKPIYSKLLKEYNFPNIENVTQALARKFNWTIAPSSDTALNYLHLTTQITNSYKFISDGPNRKFEIKPYTIEFKHCANKEISGYSYITTIVIESIKCIGHDKITKGDIDRLSNSLSKKDKEVVLKESKKASEWICKIIKKVCKNE